MTGALPPSSSGQTGAVRPLGMLGSIAYAILAIAVQYAVTALVVTAWNAVSPGGVEQLQTIAPTSPVIWFGMMLALPFQIAVLFSAVRERGGFRAYLAVEAPSRAALVFGLGLLAALVPAFDAVTYALGRDVVPSFLIESYRSAKTAGALPALFVAVVVAAPIGEELLFRGFLFRGFASRLGPRPAIVATALAWAVLHVQYDWFGVVQILLIGLVFGYLRLRSSSVLLPMILHAAANLYASVQTVIKVEWLS